MIQHGSKLSDTAAAPRDISTRSQLAQLLERVTKIDSHLADAQREHWDYCEPPQQAGAVAPNSVTHPHLLESIATRISSIADRVEYIAARL
jgi:hypothetical protein